MDLHPLDDGRHYQPTVLGLGRLVNAVGMGMLDVGTSPGEQIAGAQVLGCKAIPHIGLGLSFEGANRAGCHRPNRKV